MRDEASIAVARLTWLSRAVSRINPLASPDEFEVLLEGHATEARRVIDTLGPERASVVFEAVEVGE